MRTADPDGRGSRRAGVRLREDAATLDWNSNPFRYVGMVPGQMVDDEEFQMTLRVVQEESNGLSADTVELQSRLGQNAAELSDA